MYFHDEISPVTGVDILMALVISSLRGGGGFTD